MNAHERSKAKTSFVEEVIASQFSGSRICPLLLQAEVGYRVNRRFLSFASSTPFTSLLNASPVCPQNLNLGILFGPSSEDLTLLQRWNVTPCSLLPWRWRQTIPRNIKSHGVTSQNQQYPLFKILRSDVWIGPMSCSSTCYISLPPAPVSSP
jgi:hypothetical protein